MDRPTRKVLARMPLAESVLLLWRWVADEEHLSHMFERFRGRCYQKIISFSTMVHLIADALLQYGGSGNESFQRGCESGRLEASVQAAYGKLRRLPIQLSMAFLAESTDHLRELFPSKARRQPPKCVRSFQVITLDGKAIKRVAKRLKPLRGTAGGLLGGRALVAMEFATGMAIAMHAHPDGDANDVRFVPQLLPEIRGRISGRRLWMADRQFCDLVQMEHFTSDKDHFLVRYHPKVGFHPDRARPQREGVDDQQRRYIEQWGWLGSLAHKKRRYVRRITLKRRGEEDVILVTDLLDQDQYLALDLLNLYLERWGIERMFQKVTEVFGLQGLIGGTPEATIFQFAFCLLLYNQIQLVRSYVAEHQRQDYESLSIEKLFLDVERELIAWTVMFPAEMTTKHFQGGTLHHVRSRLDKLLQSPWSDRWLKSTNRQRRKKKHSQGKRTHGSVFRILQNTTNK